jgi:hypothetical protein
MKFVGFAGVFAVEADISERLGYGYAVSVSGLFDFVYV